MKKSLVLAMAMALGVTASAYAANPFSDVPAGHWAYDSISKLAAAGVIEGYGDTTFGGDKLMTRYEMAQIVAKAMARGANVDRLAAEFADELDSLGVRVANLEKKADNVKITGQVRYNYVDLHNANTSNSNLRTRLWVNGQINDNWSYTGMIQNNQELDNNSGDEETKLKRAYVDGRIGGLQVHAGRWDEVTNVGSVLDSYVDGVKVSYGDKVKVYGIAAKAADGDAVDGALTENDHSKLYVAGLEAQLGAFNTYFTYFKADNVEAKYRGTETGEKQVYNVGANVDVAKNLNLAYEYMWGANQYDKGVSKDGFVTTLAYGGAEADKVGSWGLHASYYDQPINAILSPTYDAEMFLDNGGYKGWSVGAEVTLAKNIQAVVNYYDTEAKKDSNKDEQVIYSELYFFF